MMTDTATTNAPDRCPQCGRLVLCQASVPDPTGWQPIETAPKDGTAILGFGIHSGSPPDAQRGVRAGDYWWAIILWDIWRNPDRAGWGERSLWVFAKDGTPTWSHPTHWMPLRKPVDVMTERMREHAGVARRVFQRTPHPGADEPDPD